MSPCVVQGRISPYQRRQIVSVVAAIILCTQFQLFLMAQKEAKQPRAKAQWSDEEVDVLLDHLLSEVSKIAGTTFKDETFTQAAKKVTALQKPGGEKDLAQCKGKWRSVCLSVSYSLAASLTPYQYPYS
jgi:hypothetical protein